MLGTHTDQLSTTPPGSHSFTDSLEPSAVLQETRNGAGKAQGKPIGLAWGGVSMPDTHTHRLLMLFSSYSAFSAGYPSLLTARC